MGGTEAAAGAVLGGRHQTWTGTRAGCRRAACLTLALASMLTGGRPARAESVPVCGARPEVDCASAPAPARSVLRLRNGRHDRADRLQWRWIGAGIDAATPLGDPTTATGYHVCAYDGAATLILDSELPGGSVCDGGDRACWRALARGYRYRDRAAARAGLSRVAIKVGRRKTHVLVKARAEQLALPDPAALTPPITVELRNGAGGCWRAVYATDVRSRRGRMQARID